MTSRYRDNNFDKNDNRYNENNAAFENGFEELPYTRRSSKLDSVMEHDSEKFEADIDEYVVPVPQNKAEPTLEERKLARQKKQKESFWLQKNAIIFAAFAILFVIIICVTAVFITAKVKEKNNVPSMENSVLCVDGEYYSKGEFTYFCSTVLESEYFDTLAENTSDISAISDGVKSRAVMVVEEFTCKVNEAKKAGLSLSDDEKDALRKELSENGVKNDEYTVKHYGLTYNEYFEICCNMKILGKYVDKLGKSAPIDEASQKTVFEQNETILSSTEVKMIYFNISELDKTGIAQCRLNAESMLAYVKEGSDITKLSFEYSDENRLFNVTEKSGDITVTLDYSDRAKYGRLCEEVCKMKVGESKIIETESEICVVLCEKKNGFESMYNSTALVNMTKQIYVSNHFETVMEAGKYFAEKNEKLYAEIDLKPYVEAAIADSGLEK